MHVSNTALPPIAPPIGSVPPFYSAPATVPVARDAAMRAIAFANAVAAAGPYMGTVSRGHHAGVWNALRTAGMQAEMAAHMVFRLQPTSETAMQRIFDTGWSARAMAEHFDQLHAAGKDRGLTLAEHDGILRAAIAVARQAAALLRVL